MAHRRTQQAVGNCFVRPKNYKPHGPYPLENSGCAKRLSQVPENLQRNKPEGAGYVLKKMNLKKSFAKLTLIILLASYFLLPTPYSLLPTSPALAQESDQDRINDIAKQLNCPTCAGINLADCRTQTCEQWRGQIGDLVEEGYTDQEVLDYFSARYGDQVLQEPPKRGFTLILWVLPVIALLGGGVWFVYTIRRWHKRQPASTVATPVPVPEHTPDTLPEADDYLGQVDQDLEIEA
jgi:cytochrome c-type biogenesis protein CcmH